jgi:hypothetical protein
VAVLGARRPGVDAWNFVILGLLAVLLLPLADTVRVGRGFYVDLPRALFLAGILTAGLFNYLPTRLALAVGWLAVGCAVELLNLSTSSVAAELGKQLQSYSRLLLALAPWVAWARLRRPHVLASDVDRLWFDFRDRFGLVWGQRLREQFNRAAINAGWPVELRWSGLALHQPMETCAESVLYPALELILRALLKRFGPAEADSATLKTTD